MEYAPSDRIGLSLHRSSRLDKSGAARERFKRLPSSGRSTDTREGRLASPQPRYVASIPSAAIRIPAPAPAALAAHPNPTAPQADDVPHAAACRAQDAAPHLHRVAKPAACSSNPGIAHSRLPRRSAPADNVADRGSGTLSNRAARATPVGFPSMHETNLATWQHGHAFGLDQRKTGERRTLTVALLTAATMVVEVVAGLAFGSMALLADGLHMASHATALGIAVLVYVYARRRAGDSRFAFGTGKVNALGGYTSALLLTGFALYMAIESVMRFVAPVPIAFDQAILVAVLGLLVNGISVALLGVAHEGDGHHHDDHYGHRHHDHHHGQDHNLRGAYLHVLADAFTSVLAIVALVAGKYAGAVWLDPMMGVVGALLVGRWAWSLRSETAARRCSTGRRRQRFAMRSAGRSRAGRTPASPTCTSGRSARGFTRRNWRSCLTTRRRPRRTSACSRKARSSTLLSKCIGVPASPAGSAPLIRTVLDGGRGHHVLQDASRPDQTETTRSWPKCPASTPSAATRIPCACSCRTGRPFQLWLIAHSRTLRYRQTTCQTHEPAGLEVPPSASRYLCTRC